MQLKAGSRVRSAVCDVELIVVKAPPDDIALECGGHPVVPLDGERPAGLELDPQLADGTPIGKRFADPDRGLEVLVTKPGQGTISLGSIPMPLKDAKPLPSSD